MEEKQIIIRMLEKERKAFKLKCTKKGLSYREAILEWVKEA